jgi:hypothetical protein
MIAGVTGGERRLEDRPLVGGDDALHDDPRCGTQRAGGTHRERIRIEQHGFMGTVWFAGYSSRSDTST